jgi:hypothetical protein
MRFIKQVFNETKLKMKTRILIFSLLIVAIFTSCQKEAIESVEKNNCSELLYFDTRADFEKSANLVMHMTEKERLNWEESNGVKSFGLEADRFYKTIDPKSFKSVKEILQFVKKHENFLELIEDDKGEYELDIRHKKNADRYLMNLDQIYQIADSVYKVFAEGTVVTLSKDSYLFYEAGNDLDFLKNQKGFVYIPSASANVSSLKSTAQECGTSGVWRSTVENERLKVEINTYGSGSYVYCNWNVQPYTQVLGIWFGCFRKISASISLSIKYLDQVSPNTYAPVQTTMTPFYSTYVNSSGFGDSRTITTSVNNQGSNEYFPRFVSYSIWADSEDVSPINPSCN